MCMRVRSIFAITFEVDSRTWLNTRKWIIATDRVRSPGHSGADLRGIKIFAFPRFHTNQRGGRCPGAPILFIYYCSLVAYRRTLVL